ncbi:amidase [Aurantimonas sp. MSK8Z-1]|uniref:amidase n=1 Tax=Mangrovibrevibacter kandeliae TaxID=2968473 RepID=UPI002117CC3C|nr:amidase [Aurantimonas sp. MSK8Z-1]MCW4114726.1 amidase [Aurantimonas sp. MSK8Z-1]
MSIPAAWLPAATMSRVVCHWSAGAYTASALDRQHYHLIIEEDGNLVRGDRSIKDNEAPIRGNYAAHTLNCNTGSIGVSLACMAGAVESPFSAGRYPMTLTQWQTLAEVVAELCRRYAIPVTPQTILSHAEVQGTLGIRQRGKWDYTRLPFDGSLLGAAAVGHALREAVTAALAAVAPKAVLAVPTAPNAERGEPQAMELHGVTTAGALNFRGAPDGEVTGSLPRGTDVAILDSDDGWYRVRSPAGYLGWVSARYVSLI